jgi:hypothetical protein
VKGEPWHKAPIAEVVADKGYHKTSTLLALKQNGYRTYIPEKKQHGDRSFVDKGGKSAAEAYHANRARTSRTKGKNHQRRRSEMLERPNQHLYDRGDLRELTMTGQTNVKKRVVIQAVAFNLGAVMRKLLGAGAPRWLLARAAFFIAILTSMRTPTACETTNSHRCHVRSWWRLPPLSRAAFVGIRVFTSAS